MWRCDDKGGNFMNRLKERRMDNPSFFWVYARENDFQWRKSRWKEEKRCFGLLLFGNFSPSCQNSLHYFVLVTN